MISPMIKVLRKEAVSKVEDDLTNLIKHETENILLAEGFIKAVFPAKEYDACKAKLARIQAIAREANVQIQEIIEDRDDITKFAIMEAKMSILIIEGAKTTIEAVRNTGK